jgi:hypothetical protein
VASSITAVAVARTVGKDTQVLVFCILLHSLDKI